MRILGAIGIAEIPAFAGRQVGVLCVKPSIWTASLANGYRKSINNWNYLRSYQY